MSDPLHDLAVLIAREADPLDVERGGEQLATVIEAALHDVEAAAAQRALRVGRVTPNAALVATIQDAEAAGPRWSVGADFERLPAPPPAPPLPPPSGCPTVCISLGPERLAVPLNGASRTIHPPSAEQEKA